MTDQSYLDIIDMYKKMSKYNAAKLYDKFNKKYELWIQTLNIIDEYILYLNNMNISPQNIVLSYLKNINSGKIKYIIEIGYGLFRDYHEIISSDKELLSQGPMNLLAFSETNKYIIYMYDFIKLNNIIQTNPENISIKNNFIDILIIYFRMWGNNIENYINEAHRILEKYGILIIIDIDINYEKIKEILSKKFIIIKTIINSYFFIEAIKK